MLEIKPAYCKRSHVILQFIAALYYMYTSTIPSFAYCEHKLHFQTAGYSYTIKQNMLYSWNKIKKVDIIVSVLVFLYYYY